MSISLKDRVWSDVVYHRSDQNRIARNLDMEVVFVTCCYVRTSLTIFDHGVISGFKVFSIKITLNTYNIDVIVQALVYLNLNILVIENTTYTSIILSSIDVIIYLLLLIKSNIIISSKFDHFSDTLYHYLHIHHY